MRGLLEPWGSAHLGWVVGDLGATYCGPVDATEVGVSLDLLDVAEADPLSGVFGQELLLVSGLMTFQELMFYLLWILNFAKTHVFSWVESFYGT